MDFQSQLRDKAQVVNSEVRRILAMHARISDDLKEPIRYTLESPGKRIRGAVVLWCCEVVSGQSNSDAEIAAAAIEMVHAYSLVHDDLPAMDDDDVRRGQPTCHKAFDEATAILTGDALLTLAFEVLARDVTDPEIAVKLIGELAEAAGPAGMIAGQMADLQAENIPGGVEQLEYIHINKTAKMFRCAAAMGAVTARANDSDYKALCDYGLKIGLGFQIADDILDVSASSEQLGKTAGKDEKAGKLTYPALVGIERSKQLERQLADQAVNAVEMFGEKADVLRQLAMAMLERTK